MKTMILAILVLLFGLFTPACVDDPSATNPDAGSELSPLLGDWEIMIDRSPCAAPTDPTGAWRFSFSLLPHNGLVMVSETYPENVTLTAGASLDGDTGRVRFEGYSSGDVYDLEISDVDGTASAFVVYEHQHCHTEGEATSVKHSRF